MLWLAIHLPRLALDLAEALAPEAGGAFALVDGPPQRRLIHCVNAAASKAGVAPGQSLNAALAACPQLRLGPRQPAAEQAALEHLAACLYGISAEVSLAAPDGIVLEAAASRRLFAGGAGVLAAVRAVLADLGLSARLGLAPTPSAAELAARLRDGSHALSHRALRQLVDSAPLALAPLSAQSRELLAASGLRRIGEALKLPRDALARRIGSADLQRLDQLIGAHADPRALYRPADRFHRRLELPATASTSQALQFPLRRLVRDLAVLLQAGDLGVQQFELAFGHQNLPPTQLSVAMLAVARDPAALIELAEQGLARLSLPQEVLTLTLRADTLLPFAPVQTDLFQHSAGSADGAARLLERLRARLGDQAIVGIGLHPEHRPERASRTQPAPLPDDDRVAYAVPAAQPPTSSTARPNWLLANPQPIAAQQLQLLSGPERIESGWWDGDDCRRDYFVARDPDGRSLWVFHHPGEPAHWYLHGVFG